ncbi:putative phosphoketolase [Mesorhizobium sp. L-8-10]|uniref:phosphoketolase family protein n=1 Tax=unclassified Mesorhizobium TaxID=325217 RepID=UPI001926A55B|nr:MULTISPECIES: phosphoketolase family protein [unclassified Mesorhizobium]BCH21978.1 putative phosphoketolase [Mesorhizobium sp. L-8-3]BCH29672.1 putative phosphoketolase [Mesorhizobium sp. L-8-10]
MNDADAAPLSETELEQIDAYWRAANYLTVGQIYLLDNPLLREPLRLEHVKPRLLGHWGTSPGLSFIYAHLNRVIRRQKANMIYICGPGHGGPAMVANAYLEGTYSELNPDVPLGEAGLRKLFRQFSFPGGIPSHAAPEVPGSIHEGGELGYALSHAYGAAFDNPGLVVACVIGDGEAETGPLATAWHSNKFLNPIHDGAVLPILHLNGYKIANPTILARIPHAELRALLVGYGYDPLFVEGDEPTAMHQRMATVLDQAMRKIHAIQDAARSGHGGTRPAWPVVVLRSPKGWTGPKEVDGLKTEGFWRAHQVPLSGLADNPEHLKMLEEWMLSYRPQELFDDTGRPKEEIRDTTPTGPLRMSANPHANGGQLRKPLELPDLSKHAVGVPQPGAAKAEATRVMGGYLRAVMQANLAAQNFRIVGPDETASNRLQDVFEVTERAWMEEILPEDVHLGRDGKVLEILSEHTCQGWLEGYLLTGRHGFFSCYEAFIHIVDSMFNQHAKWLDATRDIPWRQPIASLNYLLTSHVWQQDHNGFSHQDPGFVDVALNKKADIVRVYFPPDANSLLCVTEHALQTWDRINIIVAGKARSWQWMSMEEARLHCDAGIGIWDWACRHNRPEPDVVMACAGDVPALETLAAVAILREHLPDLAVRVVNVVDLMALQPEEMHPHGLSDAAFDALFTTNRPVIFAYHGYPWTIHRLTYRRTNHDNIHVHGYKEEGTTTTPFDMTVLNGLDRFHLVLGVLRRLPGLGEAGDHLRALMEARLTEHHDYIRTHGQDMPEIRDWRWTSNASA